MKFFNQVLKPFVDQREIGIEYQPVLCSIVDLIRHICNPQNLSSQIALSHSDSIIQVLTFIVKLSGESNLSLDGNGDKCAIFFGTQLGATLALGQLCRYDDNSKQTCDMCPKTKATLRKLLKRYGTNTISNDGMVGSHKSSLGVIEYAVNQTNSRDLIRRALHFCSFGYDDDCMTSALFSVSRKKASLLFQASEQFARYQEQLERLNEQCEIVTRERESLEQEFANKDAFFQQQIVHIKQQSRVDASEHAETLMEEKVVLERKFMIANQELCDSSKEIEILKDENLNRENAFNNKLDLCHDKISYLEDKLKKSQQTISDKNKEIAMKGENLTDIEKKLKVVQQKLDEERKDSILLNQSHNELKDEHVNVKARLEDSLSKLISLAKIYICLEKSSAVGRKELEEKVETVQRKENEVVAKYQRLKEMYRGAEDKIKKLSLQLQKAKDVSKCDDTSNSKRRQPMGTLAFMNSIHDNSMRSEGREKHTRDYTVSGSHDSTKRSRSKKKNTNFRIVR